ncbi:DUF935 domain-containing protein [Pseudosulfitobacter sp. DSM 107133]|uniref:DUF935 domain-containing protein n=1 Tax=Pseudosulfitobacter sp. DSM 107133 TaxID=2883100 RepID=UPI000DF14177|nr:DUF935 domain-containing protein [Pseudosulfitobacter sp. DSM 107133]UOA25909.1 hypothetical protein DSM107133_00598 [Pseudosulfitobacter sp. DSM 107133]
MARLPQLLDHRGMPVRRAELREEISAPTMRGVRSPLAAYPSDGLNPERLGAILREADQGDPIRYMELAEIIEERDPHYLGVLGTRKRSVTQLPITVKEGGEDQLDLDIAKELRSWIAREELADELFDIMDAIGKGYSHTEIIWDYSSGQYWPAKLKNRKQAWFRFDRVDLETPVMLDENGQERPYPAYKFIYAQMKSKTGLPLRSGLARVATWNWLFKAYTQRDWTIFTQTYGQPLRLGKFGPGASEKDKSTLLRAVTNIGGDLAAIIPESMMIEFIEASNVGASTEHYERRSDWLDKQISKAVLGQTATTDAVTGGLGSGKEHRQVQEDIETADATQLAAILNRDLVIPWVKLNYGPRPKYPTIKLSRPEEEDLKNLAEALGPFIDRGLRVSADTIYGKFGIPAPQQGAQILHPTGQNTPPAGSPSATMQTKAPETKFEYPFNTLPDQSGVVAAEQSQQASEALISPQAKLADVLADMMQAPMQSMMDQIEGMVEAAGSLEELRESLLAGFPHLDADRLIATLAEGMSAADLGGRAALEVESG